MTLKLMPLTAGIGHPPGKDHVYVLILSNKTPSVTLTTIR